MRVGAYGTLVAVLGLYATLLSTWLVVRPGRCDCGSAGSDRPRPGACPPGGLAGEAPHVSLRDPCKGFPQNVLCHFISGRIDN